MRFLHTSDWHLGRTLHGVDLHDAQRAVLGQITALVADPPDGIAVDAVIIAGDVYDRAVPPVESVALFSQTLSELVQHTTVIVTSGNHDSAIRLGFGSGLYTDRLQVRTSLDSVGEPVMVGGAAIYPLPYLDPDVARIALADGAEPLARSHQAAMTAAVTRVRADLATRPTGTRSVLVAHAFVVGGAASESERSIVVGGVDHIAAGTFDGLDYVALGHLHGAQRPGPTSATVLRYSGSPLRYSFSERSHDKSVTLVDLPLNGSVVETVVSLQQPRGMAELTGTLDELLTAPGLAQYHGDWVRVTVTDRARPDQLFDRIKTRFPHALQVFHMPEGQRADEAGRHAQLATGPREIAADFISYVTRLAATSAELDLVDAAYQRALDDLGRSA
jgi:exonuclease SbcD